MTRTLKASALLVAIAVVAGAGCTVDKQEAPALSGPSVLGTSVTLFANPESLRQDGSAQSQIAVQVRDENGQPMRDVPIRLDIAVNGMLTDFGQLSAKNLVSDGDGKASAVYTAPPPPADPVDAQTVVQIWATPGGKSTGSDYANATSRAVSIRLVPPGVILPPNGTPVPLFTYSPSVPLTKSDVTFDASLSTDSDGRIVSYAWNFGDGSQGSGALVKHSYSLAGSYTVTLTVTDDRSQSASISKSVSVSTSSAPKADFAVSPTSPVVNQRVYFNAASSTAAEGRTIVRYDWDYGSGRQDSGQLVWQIYTQPGTYTVVLTVTDDAGNKGSTSKTVTVGSGALSAAFTYLPAAPARGDTVFFNGSSSSGPNGIASYSWTFGDGESATGATPSHVFACPGIASDKIFVVALTVTDSLGGSATVAKEVKVTGCGS